MRLALALTVLVLGVGPGWAVETIKCSAEAGKPVTITLKAERFAGRLMSCIAGNFVSNLTPCAPTKAFSLSAPTGSASIVGVVNRWQDYAGHNGGVVGFFKTHTTISFTGGFNTPDGGLKDDWSFSLDREAKTALLTRKGDTPVRYRCGGSI